MIPADFHERPFIRMIISERDGYKTFYSLMALMLKSVKHFGKLMVSEGKKHTFKSLAKDIRLGNARGMKRRIDVLVKYGLAQYLEDGTIYMSIVPELQEEYKQCKARNFME